MKTLTILISLLFSAQAFAFQGVYSCTVNLNEGFGAKNIGKVSIDETFPREEYVDVEAYYREQAGEYTMDLEGNKISDFSWVDGVKFDLVNDKLNVQVISSGRNILEANLSNISGVMNLSYLSWYWSLDYDHLADQKGTYEIVCNYDSRAG